MDQGIQEWTKYNLWRAAFKNEAIWSAPRLSSTNFTWSILENLDAYPDIISVFKIDSLI